MKCVIFAGWINEDSGYVYESGSTVQIDTTSDVELTAKYENLEQAHNELLAEVESLREFKLNKEGGVEFSRGDTFSTKIVKFYPNSNVLYPL